MNALNIRSASASRVIILLTSAVLLVSLASCGWAFAESHELTYVSDLISTSAPSSPATEIITFTLAHAIPRSGTITITPEPGAFSIPSELDASDIGFSVFDGAEYVDRATAADADAADDGISVVSGVNGSITITLNSTSGLNAGAAVKVSVGTQGSGVSILNPDFVRSYRISIQTRDAAGSPLDEGTAMIAVVAPVSLVLPTDILRPTIIDGLPSGEVAAGNPTIELSFETWAWANCRYATSSGISYSDMPYSFSSSDGQIFYTDLTGFVDGQSYTFYIRCINSLGNANNTDYVLSFFLDPTPDILTSSSGSDEGAAPGAGYLGPGGIGTYPNGSAYLYMSSVTLSGWTIPMQNVTILKDGVSTASVQSQADGSFRSQVSGLERGTYTFSAFTTDSRDTDSASYASSLTIGQATNNNLSNILIPPILALSSDSIASGDPLTATGEGMPNTQIEVDVHPPLSGASLADTHVYYATSTVTGSWSVDLATSTLSDGVYVAVAREIQSPQSLSGFSSPVSFTVGSGGSCSASTDLNGDKKVNLVDFSIFLTFWNTAGPEGDFNCDGTVNLADFSIMLFHWTG